MDVKTTLFRSSTNCWMHTSILCSSRPTFNFNIFETLLRDRFACFSLRHALKIISDTSWAQQVMTYYWWQTTLFTELGNHCHYGFFFCSSKRVCVRICGCSLWRMFPKTIFQRLVNFTNVFDQYYFKQLTESLFQRKKHMSLNRFKMLWVFGDNILDMAWRWLLFSYISNTHPINFLFLVLRSLEVNLKTHWGYVFTLVTTAVEGP